MRYGHTGRQETLDTGNTQVFHLKWDDTQPWLHHGSALTPPDGSKSLRLRRFARTEGDRRSGGGRITPRTQNHASDSESRLGLRITPRTQNHASDSVEDDKEVS
ncbi:hypothetical protein EYF80_035140 [Liparis tanakae]|uniref:Uncharacterized protein n=1 Tax=Liparis tanakae TaxID=230148 RepID=A0A4Z2GMW3_9TELE|nr:hypothetical protein EYF80_035140 [Liparis tanakae]